MNTEGIAQSAEHLHSKDETLSSILNTVKKRKKRYKGGRKERRKERRKA
jgi:hypothetical protein